MDRVDSTMILPGRRHQQQHHRESFEIEACFSTASSNEQRKEERQIWQRARTVVQPSKLFSFATYIYAERKFLLFLLAHILASMVVWSHFALQKYASQTQKVPSDANRYWLKVLAPSAEFGTMHAILFQMAILPLTMCRYTISQLSQIPAISKFVPFHRMLQLHILLGYTMVTLVFLATITFFGFFGVLCSDGEQAFCDKFTSEIMITGYGIIGMILLVGITSYFRHKIPYEVFYVFHHVVFLLYILTTAHTFDRKQRTGAENRSQTFKWYSASILYYVCDRVAMYMMNRYDRVPVLSNSMIRQVPLPTSPSAPSLSNQEKKDCSGMILLTLRRPALFQFQPGQYASLCIDELAKNQWHPFSIASDPDSNVLEFYIQVCSDKNSWTHKLWDRLCRERDADRTLWVSVMGPYGTPLANTREYSHAICIGAGTGVVPMLSLLKQHVRQVLRLDPNEYGKEMHNVQTRVQQLQAARDACRGSVCAKLYRTMFGANNGGNCKDEGDRMNLRLHLRSSHLHEDSKQERNDIRRAVRQVTNGIYDVFPLIFMTIYGVGLIGFTYSWCTLGIELYSGMAETSSFFTCLFFGIFAIVSFCFWNATHIINFIDIAMSLVALFVSWYWFARNLWANFDTSNMVHYTLLIGYMTARFWCQTVKTRNDSLRREVLQSGSVAMEKMQLIWITRSAPLVREIMPQIESIFESLISSAWGPKDVSKVLGIKIFVTDPNVAAVKSLQRAMQGTYLFDNGHFTFARPNLPRLIENHTLDMICTHDISHTLLSFCGSPQFSRDVHNFKIRNDITTAITGNKQHQVDFAAESYGGYKKGGKQRTSTTTTGKESLDLEMDDGTGKSSDSDEVKPSASPASPWRHSARNNDENDDIHLLLGTDSLDFATIKSSDSRFLAS